MSGLDIGIAAVSAIAAAASAFCTYAAYRSSEASRDTSERSLQLQEKQHLYETLKACAEKANSYSKGKKGADWDFYDAGNIVRCLSLAMIGIQGFVEKYNQHDAKELKRFFISQLNMELFEELNYQVGPDAFFRVEEATSMTSDICSDWSKAIDFFDFMIVTEEDLED
ncbi:hypothetical protein [Escherichia coli]|uniref:hypothetical protein n=1 Tax=Escherichia coli TaxID=562 RepID=UPI00113162E9|nr:hypothetical protein [Escherichia coli]MCX9841772.1 hypothetical protein [Escherichia coli]MDG5502726.1 hypothetical protein [Escherichia coli]HAN6622312.1 hypothetical protein [Escherichia coli]HCN0829889.1 hypothetical protein [Escherichia coli]